MSGKPEDATGRRRQLSREHRAIWWEAYRVAFEHILANGRTADRSLDRVVELATEAAWKSLEAYRAAVRRGRP